jgi:hypothetical protein
MEDLQMLMDDADMLADVKAYDAAKRRLERGEDELIPLEIAERRLGGRVRLESGAHIAGSPRKTWRRRPKYPVP